MPLVAALATAGFALSARLGRRRPDPWLIAAAVVVFLAYGAPIVLSGDPTLAGFLRLDDTATWLALTDRIMEHGHSLDGLAPSTYEATLAFNLGDGYPVGAFVPLGVGVLLTGSDPAWLIHPYMSVLASCIALCIWEISRPLIASRPLRAAVAAIGAQPALLVGYVGWGGLKEVAAAALIALCIAVALRVADEDSPRGWIAVLGVGLAALLAVLSLGGLLWVLPALIAAAALLWRKAGPGLVLARAGALAGLVAILSLPLLVPALLDGRLLPPTSSPLTSATAKGNLIEPLGLERLAGVWPAGDFRLDAVDSDVTTVLIVVVAVAALAGLAYALLEGSVTIALYGGGVALACLVLVAIGSPWVDGKAMATASPAILTLAAAGAAAAILRGRAVEGWLALAAIVIGVGWSNWLAYRDVNLAPYDQFAELEQIGEEIEGEGPTLMTEYSPFGARHFLREADPESVSELRRRPIPRLNGKVVEKGFNADTDELDTAALAAYRTLVLRRSPTQSRPPAAYEPIWRGRFYEAWQRPEQLLLPPRLPLGTRVDPSARPSCAEVEELAPQGSTLVAATASRPVAVSLAAADYPRDWAAPGFRETPTPRGEGTIVADAFVRKSARYEVWLGGSVRPGVELLVDGMPSGEVRHELNNFGQYVNLGSADLDRGTHRIELRFSGPDLHPGSGGSARAVGPLLLSDAEAADARLVRVDAADAERLCGRSWDWIEVAR